MGNETYKIKSTHEVNKTREISVDWNGFNFLIIYGRHKNGWFIAIPNWNKCTEAGEPEDVAYNATKIALTNIHSEASIYLAQAIKEHWEYLKQCEEREGN
ncbi:MAG: hypothetical protein K2O96_05815 [Lachnospiraceae bacterium]|nr:hypothetical protein [Lachnospiraceae bacterium]